jgi:uncharacterized membrane protein YhaH (DUF805 family)
MQNFDSSLRDIAIKRKKNSFWFIFLGLILIIFGTTLAVKRGNDLLAATIITSSLLPFIIALFIYIFADSDIEVIEKLTNGKNRVAAWTYKPEIWQKFRDIENAPVKKRRKKLLIWIPIFIGLHIATILVAFFAKLDIMGVAPVFIPLNLMLIYSLVALCINLVPSRLNKFKEGRILFGASEICIEGKTIRFDYANLFFDSARHDVEKNLLEIILYTPMKISGRSLTTILLPVPPNEQKTIPSIIAAFEEGAKKNKEQ